MMDRAARKARRMLFWETAHPRVSRLKTPQEHCEGIKWSTVALKDLYAYGDKPARGFQERSRCRNKGVWRFVALKAQGSAWPATSGVYCWSHLLQQMDIEAERRATEKAWDKFLEAEK